MYNPYLHFHFTGIGGSGMSGIAEILIHHGFQVSGSDQKSNQACHRLIQLGADIKIGHVKENLPKGASLLVYSSAVSMENPELQEARARGIPVVRRAEVLAELMRLKFGIAVAGSHGKTSTTSMIAAVLEQGKFDPTVIIGGQVKTHGSGGKLGKGDFLVAESDESDRSFLLLKPTLAVVTNIDNEHINAYQSLSELEHSFEAFVNAVPFYGLAVLCVDDARVKDLASRYKGRKVTYGVSPEANIQAHNISADKQSMSFDVFQGGQFLFNVNLPMPGRHMVVNSLAAIAIGLELNIPKEIIAGALASFGGVKRRLEIIGESNGITVINDYGHHPAEIRATLAALRNGWASKMNQLHVIFQPHRYSRTRDCFVDFIEAFRDCDNLVISEIYSAGEPSISGITGELLCEAISHPSKQYVEKLDDIVPGLVKKLTKGDLVVCLGAGSVGLLPESVLSQIELMNEK